MHIFNHNYFIYILDVQCTWGATDVKVRIKGVTSKKRLGTPALKNKFSTCRKALLMPGHVVLTLIEPFAGKAEMLQLITFLLL